LNFEVLIMDTPTNTPSAPSWAAIATAIAGAVAVLAKKKFSGRKSGSDRPSAPGQHALDSLSAKLDANHKEVVAAISAQSTAIEKRLDALEAAVARLDERTRLQSCSSS
jgi:hypothetical protein